MNEEPKKEDLNPLTDTTANNEVKIEEVKPVPTIDNVEPMEPVNPVPTEQAETVVEQSQQDVEVLDIDLNREKPSVIKEQVIDKVTEKKQENKSSIVLVVSILIIIALVVIFIPQISTLFK